MDEITQKEIANYIGVSDGHLSDILRGRRDMSRQVAQKIKDKTGFPYDFTLEQEPMFVVESIKNHMRGL